MIISTILYTIGAGATLGTTIATALEGAGIITAKGVARITLAGAGVGFVAGISEAIDNASKSFSIN